MPKIKLNIKDIIDILCEYDLKHQEFPGNLLANDDNEIIYGIADDNDKTIHINKIQNLNEKRNTVIHELVHCKCYRYNPSTTENEIRKYANKMYMKLYRK